jgi:hypothetical protein
MNLLRPPREIFGAANIHSAYAFVMVHIHPSGHTKPSEASGSRHRRPGNVGGQGFFSFQKAGLLG